MKDEEMVNKIAKAQDWWSHHNFGTRVTLMVLLLLTTVTILVPIIFNTSTVLVNGIVTEVPRNIPNYDIILSSIVQSTAWAFVVVTVGPNTIGKVAEAWVNFKGAK